MDRGLLNDTVLGSSVYTAPAYIGSGITINGAIGDVWAIMASMAVGAGDGVARHTTYLEDQDTLGLSLNENSYNNVADLQSAPMFAFAKFTTADPQTYQMVYDPHYSGLGAGGTVRFANLSAFKLGPRDVSNADEYYNGTAVGSTTSTSYVELHGKDFVVPSDGDYLIIAHGKAGKENISTMYKVALAMTDPSAVKTRYSEANMLAKTAYGSGSPHYTWPYHAMIKLTLTAGTWRIGLDALTVTSGQVNVDEITLYALRMADFPSAYYAESRGETSITVVDGAWPGSVTIPDVWTQKVAQINQIPNNLTLVLGTSINYQTANNKFVNTRLTFDGTDFHGEHITSINGSNELCLAGVYGLTPALGKRTFTLKGCKTASGGGSGVVRVADAALAILLMKDNATIRVHAGNIRGGNWY